MNYFDEYQSIKEYVDSLPAFSDRDRCLCPSSFQNGITLESIFENSSAAWGRVISAASGDARDELIYGARFNAAFGWIEKGVMLVHGIDERITPESWGVLSNLIADDHKNDVSLHEDALARLGYERIIVDSNLKTKSVNKEEILFLPAFSIGRFAVQNMITSDGKHSDESVEATIEEIRKRHSQMKFVALYFGALSNSTLHKNVGLTRFFELAGELDIPVQLDVDSGMNSIADFDALSNILESHSSIRFVLRLNGIVGINEIASLVLKHSNAFPSIGAIALLCPSAAMRALRSFIDAAPSINSIAWGGDGATAEESVGALCAWRHVVSSVLVELVCEGRATRSDANVIARSLLFENGWNIYAR